MFICSFNIKTTAKRKSNTFDILNEEITKNQSIEPPQTKQKLYDNMCNDVYENIPLEVIWDELIQMSQRSNGNINNKNIFNDIIASFIDLS